MGYGGSATVRQTILDFGAANIAGVLIKYQAGDSSEGGMKRSVHIKIKDVVPFKEALQQIKAAVSACDKYKALMGTDSLLILA